MGRDQTYLAHVGPPALMAALQQGIIDEDGRALPEWRTTPCLRCSTYHPRYCDMCAGSPPCADHECSWPDDEEDAHG